MAKVSKRTWKAPDGGERTAYVVRYMHGGKHRSKQFERKKDADAFRQAMERERHHGKHIAPSDGATVEFAAEAFLRHSEDRVRQGAIGGGQLAALKCHFDRYILPEFANRKLQTVTPVELQAWFHSMIRDSNLQPVSAKHRLATFGNLFSFALRRRWVAENPVPTAFEDIGRIRHNKVEMFTTAQVAHLLLTVETRRKHARERTFHNIRCAVHLAAFCGLRLGEILALKRKHVRLDLGVVEVRHSLCYWSGIKGPKSAAGVREVPMPTHLCEMLATAMKLYAGGEDDLVIANRDGEPLTLVNFRNWWTGLLAEAGFLREDGGKQYHFHSLRHFAASMMLRSGVLALPDVSKMIGHSNVDTTARVYAHALATKTQGADAMQAMAMALMPGPEMKVIEATPCA